jgi:hypothetical protein
MNGKQEESPYDLYEIINFFAHHIPRNRADGAHTVLALPLGCVQTKKSEEKEDETDLPQSAATTAVAASAPAAAVAPASAVTEPNDTRHFLAALFIEVRVVHIVSFQWHKTRRPGVEYITTSVANNIVPQHGFLSVTPFDGVRRYSFEHKSHPASIFSYSRIVLLNPLTIESELVADPNQTIAMVEKYMKFEETGKGALRHDDVMLVKSFYFCGNREFVVDAVRNQLESDQVARELAFPSVRQTIEPGKALRYQPISSLHHSVSVTLTDEEGEGYRRRGDILESSTLRHQMHLGVNPIPHGPSRNLGMWLRLGSRPFGKSEP